MTSESAVLLDVNVLVALAWPNHVHHPAAMAWWRGRNREPWATCPATQFGFVRVSSNRKLSKEAKTPFEVVSLLQRIVELPGHVFWPDDVSILDRTLLDPARLLGHRQVTDAHLVGLAIRHEGRIASFDRGMLEVVPAEVDREGVVELLGST